MSRPIIVVKEKQTKQRSFFAFICLFSGLLHVESLPLPGQSRAATEACGPGN